jgi:hypothetical protein
MSVSKEPRVSRPALSLRLNPGAGIPEAEIVLARHKGLLLAPDLVNPPG